MKKWLNIKQKVNDFSEDEADTETESEDDDGMCFIMLTKRVCETNISDQVMMTELKY